MSGTETALTVTQRTSSGLARIRDPLQWVARQKLPVFTSYTEAEHVNKFLLIVGMNGRQYTKTMSGHMGKRLRQRV